MTWLPDTLVVGASRMLIPLVMRRDGSTRPCAGIYNQKSDGPFAGHTLKGVSL
jgi:hypothetical protein